MLVVPHTTPLLIPVCHNSKDQYGKQAAPKHYALECHKCLKGMTPNEGSVIAMLCILQFTLSDSFASPAVNIYFTKTSAEGTENNKT